MTLILFDTNIFIDMLNGVHQASVELSSYDMPAISFITYMELRCGEFSRPPRESDPGRCQMDAQIMEAAIEIRDRSLATKPAIKLPDAIIAATARVNNSPIVTRIQYYFLLTPPHPRSIFQSFFQNVSKTQNQLAQKNAK